MITLLDRYIGRGILLGTMLVLGVLLALFVVLVLVDVLPDYGRGTFGGYEIARYVILSQPRKIFELFPIAALIGTLFGLSVLARNAELVAMRAAGLSKARIVGAALKAGLVLILAVVALGEFVVPTAETLAQAGRAQALMSGFRHKDSGLWLRDGESFVRLGEVLPDLSLVDIQIYDVDASTNLRSHTRAERAVYADSAWQLTGVARSYFDADVIRTEVRANDVWRAALTPDLVAIFTVRAEALSLAQLAGYIDHLRANRQDASRYVLTWWQKALLPVTTVIMVLLASSFVFHPVRSGGLALRVFLGVMLGLAVAVVYRSLGYLGLIYGTPPLLAAVAPLLIFLLVALVLLGRAH